LAPTVSTCSAITKEGIDDVWNTISKVLGSYKSNNYFFEKRQNKINGMKP
jgi:LAO/AO transport system kinase